MAEQTARRIYRNPALYTVGIGYFLVQAALSPIAIVLPSMGRTFEMGMAAAGWVQSAFLLSLTALMLPAGRLGDFLGHRRIFAYGIGLLGLATVAAPLAPSFGWLVALRFLQGIGGAMATGTSLAVVAQEFPAAHLGRCMGIVNMMSSAGAVTSLLVTGLLVDRMGWRAAFVVLVPVGVLGMAAVGPFWRSRPSVAQVPVDLPGLVLLALAVLGLYLTVSPVSAAGLSEAFQPVMGTLTLAAGGALLWWERRVPIPIFDVGQLRRAGFATGLGAHCIYHMSMMVNIFSIPFFVERALGLPAVWAAGALLPMQILTSAMGLGGGWLYDRVRSPWLATAALAGVCVTFFALGFLAPSLSWGGLAAVLAVVGTCGGLFMSTNNPAIMASAGPGLHGFASGMLETLRQLGHGFAVPILTASVASAVGAPGRDAAFLGGYGTAMLVMGSILFTGVLLSATRRPAPGEAPAESPAPALAAR